MGLKKRGTVFEDFENGTAIKQLYQIDWNYSSSLVLCP